MAERASQLPEVSVVIPTHNRRDLLALGLRSALGQRGVRHEVIVVDDGSTDDTQGLLEGIRDDRLRVLRTSEPRGVTAARNRGIEEARGEWVAFLDDDDLWAPEKMARQIAAARDRSAEWLYTGAVIIDDRHRVQGGDAPPSPEFVMEALPHWDPIPGGCSGVAVSRGALDATGPFSQEFGTLADWELWLRLAARGSPACVARPLVAYRRHAGNMSLDVRRTLVELDRLEARHRIVVDRSRFNRHLAGLCLRSGRKIEALRLLFRAAFVDRTGYGGAEAKGDLSMLWRFAVEGASRRLGLSSPSSRRRRHLKERSRDAHLEWKFEAQRWLDELVQPPADPASRSTHA